MPTIPSHHVVGDSGHTTDHNAMVDVLADHETRIAGIQTAQPGYMLKSGNNTVSVANPSGYAENVIVPAGSRDGTYVKSVTVGGKRTFGLDTNGQLRVSSYASTDVPFTVWGFDATQSADLTRWRTHEAGPIVARVDSVGNIYAPNITPSTWTNITLASGIAWNSTGGARPQYRVVGDVVELRGSVKRTTDTDFTVSPSDVGTLPVDVRPPYWVYSAQAANFVDSTGYVRVEVQTSGLIRFYFANSGVTYQPRWIQLDGIRYSRTA